jgi:hypothetical protein
LEDCKKIVTSIHAFVRIDDLFTIHFENDGDTLRFGLEKTRSKTLENFTENAQAFKLDPDKIGKFKEVFMTDEYEQLQNGGKSKRKNSDVQDFNAFKYSTGIPLAEQIKLNDKYVFLQIVDGKPVISDHLDLSKTQKMMLYPIGKTPINDFEYDSEEEIKQIIQVAKTKTINELYTWSNSIWQKFVVATPEQLTLLTVDSIFTFFQNRFTTTHYHLYHIDMGTRYTLKRNRTLYLTILLRRSRLNFLLQTQDMAKRSIQC